MGIGKMRTSRDAGVTLVKAGLVTAPRMLFGTPRDGDSPPKTADCYAPWQHHTQLQDVLYALLLQRKCQALSQIRGRSPGHCTLYSDAVSACPTTCYMAMCLDMVLWHCTVLLACPDLPRIDILKFITPSPIEKLRAQADTSKPMSSIVLFLN